MRELEHFVGGKSVAGTSGRTGVVFDPARGVQPRTVPLAVGRRGGQRGAGRQGGGGRVGLRLTQRRAPPSCSACASC